MKAIRNILWIVLALNILSVAALITGEYFFGYPFNIPLIGLSVSSYVVLWMGLVSFAGFVLSVILLVYNLKSGNMKWKTDLIPLVLFAAFTLFHGYAWLF